MNIENWADNFIDRGSQQTHKAKLNFTSISTSTILRHLWPQASGGLPQTRLSSVIYMLESQVFTHFAPRGCSPSTCPQDTPRRPCVSVEKMTLLFPMFLLQCTMDGAPVISTGKCYLFSTIYPSSPNTTVPFKQTVDKLHFIPSTTNNSRNKKNRQKWWKRQSEHSGENKK